MMGTIRIPLSVFSDRATSKLPMFPQSGGWVAGGAARRLFMGLPQTSDVDLFFSSDQAEKDQREALIADGFKMHRDYPRAAEVRRGDVRVQLINFQRYETIESVLDSFDFTICQFAIDCVGQCLVATAEAIVDATRRSLVAHKISFPIASMRRLMKYERQGFKPCTGTFKAIAEACQKAEIDLTTQYID